MPLKRWIWPGETKQADELAAAGIQPLTARVLASRGIGSPNEARRFLSTEGELHDPFLMKGMEQAVALIEGALQEGKLIVIYGDYDCDGITSTVLLYRYLEEQGANVGYYIPDREDEGYGLNMEACETLHQNGAELVITVDNGISAAAEIDRLHELGIKVVVTDHHQPPEILPAADALIDPHCEDSGYPFRELCGVGVAFKLVCALEGDIEGVDTLARYADLAAIGTIADVVPLCGENRIIARAGLQKMEESENPGICALLAAAGLAEKALGAESVSFGLAPRLNAASRMGNCDDSVALMLCDDPQQAAVLAERVDAANRERKQLEGAIMADIARQVEEDPSLLRYRVLVLAGEGWHHGIVGIAASRMVERYGKPCLLIGTQGEEARGSARSVPGFSVIDAITRCKDCLIKFGGHPLAAGFSLKTSDVGRLRAALERAAAGMAPDMPIPQLPLDAGAASAGAGHCDHRAAERARALRRGQRAAALPAAGGENRGNQRHRGGQALEAAPALRRAQPLRRLFRDDRGPLPLPGGGGGGRGRQPVGIGVSRAKAAVDQDPGPTAPGVRPGGIFCGLLLLRAPFARRGAHARAGAPDHPRQRGAGARLPRGAKAQRPARRRGPVLSFVLPGASRLRKDEGGAGRAARGGADRKQGRAAANPARRGEEGSDEHENPVPLT